MDKEYWIRRLRVIYETGYICIDEECTLYEGDTEIKKSFWLYIEAIGLTKEYKKKMDMQIDIIKLILNQSVSA